MKSILIGVLLFVLFFALLGGILYQQFRQDAARQAELKALPKLSVSVPSPRGVDQLRYDYLSATSRSKFSVDDWRAVVESCNPGKDVYREASLVIPTDKAVSN